MNPPRATKLVCTLGPASGERVEQLVAAGMDVARLNLTHGTREDHERLVAAVRSAAEAAGRPIAVMTDLSGPKVRLGDLPGGEMELQEGVGFALRPEEAGGGAGATTNYSGLASDLEQDDRVLLSDGVVELRVVEAAGDEVRTEVVRGGLIRSRAGVNVPAERLGLPAITEKDERDLAWVREADVDLVSQSFVRRAEEVRALRDLLGDASALVVAKIETAPAVEDCDRILEAADVVMVARGDLGVELPPEEIPVIQKDLVDRANRAGVPVVVATQMLESMTENPRPTRAEASDVAHAVFDGAAGVLLSAETAIGRYPVEAAATAGRILREAETRGKRFLSGAVEEMTQRTDAHAIAHAARAVVDGGSAKAIACFTRTGLTARLLAGVRPSVPIYAFSHDERVVRRLTIFRGVHSMRCDLPEDTDAMLSMMDRRIRDDGLASAGDPVVLVASTPVGKAKTNLLKVHRVG